MCVGVREGEMEGGRGKKKKTGDTYEVSVCVCVPQCQKCMQSKG